ncbi:MAG: hypothetical protein KY393_09025, partial [Actinobacteria bacterium]|nr:hypothetical protein [Actinomycetota bacterium]
MNLSDHVPPPRVTARESPLAPVDGSLNRDLRYLEEMLDESLERQQGRKLLDLVRRVRSLASGPSSQDTVELRNLLDGCDLQESISLVRAFSAFNRLANVAQQVHQVAELAAHDLGAAHPAVQRRLVDHGPQLDGRRFGQHVLAAHAQGHAALDPLGVAEVRTPQHGAG